MLNKMEHRNQLIECVRSAVNARSKTGSEVVEDIGDNPDVYIDFDRVQMIWDEIYVVGNQILFEGDYTLYDIKGIEHSIGVKYDFRPQDLAGKPVGEAKNITPSERNKALLNILTYLKTSKLVEKVAYKPAMKNNFVFDPTEKSIVIEIAPRFTNLDQRVIDEVEGWDQEKFDIFMNFLNDETIFSFIDALIKLSLLRRVNGGGADKKYLAWLKALSDAGKSFLVKILKKFIGVDTGVDLSTIGTSADKAAFNISSLMQSLLIVDDEFTIFTNNYKKTGDMIAVRKLYATQSIDLLLPYQLVMSAEDHIRNTATKQIINRLSLFNNDFDSIMEKIESKGFSQPELASFTEYYVYSIIKDNMDNVMKAVGNNNIDSLMKSWKVELTALDSGKTMNDTVTSVIQALEAFAEDEYKAKIEINGMPHGNFDEEKERNYAKRKYKEREKLLGFSVVQDKSIVGGYILRIKSGHKHKFFEKHLIMILRECMPPKEYTSIQYEISGKDPIDFGMNIARYDNKDTAEMIIAI